MTFPVIEHNVQQPGGAEYFSLGKSERPDCCYFRLRTSHHCVVDLDDEGRIQRLQWQLPIAGLQPGLLHSFNDPDNFPFTLLRLNAEPLLVRSQSSLLAGTKGIAVKTIDGEVVWIPSEEIIGFAFQLTTDSGTDQAPATDSAKIKAGEAK